MIVNNTLIKKRFMKNKQANKQTKRNNNKVILINKLKKRKRKNLIKQLV